MARPGALSIVFLLAVRALAINEEMGTRTLVQPDGTRFPVREYVDEFGHYLVAGKGYVVQDTTTGYYHYARYDRDGRAIPSSLRVGRDDGSDKVGRLNSENEQSNFRPGSWGRARDPICSTGKTVLTDFTSSSSSPEEGKGSKP